MINLNVIMYKWKLNVYVSICCVLFEKYWNIKVFAFYNLILKLYKNYFEKIYRRFWYFKKDY